MIWKVWTEVPERNTAGGVYLFADENSANAYVDKHTTGLAGFGITDITATSYQVNETLSLINHAILKR